MQRYQKVNYTANNNLTTCRVIKAQHKPVTFSYPPICIANGLFCLCLDSYCLTYRKDSERYSQIMDLLKENLDTALEARPRSVAHWRMKPKRFDFPGLKLPGYSACDAKKKSIHRFTATSLTM